MPDSRDEDQTCLFERSAPPDKRSLRGETIVLPRVDFTWRSDLDNDEPIDRLRRQGPRSLSNTELLSLLLGTSEREVIDDFLRETGLVGLSQIDEIFFQVSPWEEGPTATLIAAAELARRLARARLPERRFLNRPDLVANYLTLRYQGDQEVVGALFFDVRNQLIAEREIYRGTSDRSPFDRRDVLKLALLYGASTIIVFHTHPSGDPSPSTDDLRFTRSLAEAASVIGMELRDHLILGRGGRWVSLQSRMPF